MLKSANTLLGTGLLLATMTSTQVHAASSINLPGYQLAGTWSLPGVTASEASAITWNWDSNSFFTIGDEGEYLVEVNAMGQQQSVMALSGFDDPEGLTYIGNGQFVVAEERYRDAYLLTYAAGGNLNRSTLDYADLGFWVGNIGLEGISYDPRDGSYVTVKEKNPQEINVNQISFGSPGSATINSLFTPNLGMADLGDVLVLATTQGGLASEDNLLILSQESSLLAEVDRDGNIIGSLDLALLGLVDSVEGVTMDDQGIIYLVAENGDNPLMYTLAPAPVPLPAAAWLMGSGLLMLLARLRRS